MEHSSNKNVIFICPRFYKYEYHIQETLKKNGYMVSYISHRINKLIDSVIQFFPLHIQKNIYEKVLLRKINKLRGNFTHFFVIKGEYLTKEHLNLIKENNPKIKTILYQWDSINNFDYIELSKCFDKIFSFDFEDSNKYKFNYLPLFYTNEIQPVNGNEIIDYLLIGIFNQERYNYSIHLKSLCKKNNLIFKSYIYIPFGYYLKNVIFHKKFKINSIRDIKFRSLNRKNLLKLYANSKVFVDISSPKQTGLSMRVIEAYGMNKKILTANQFIKQDKYVNEILFLNTDVDDNKLIKFPDMESYNYKNRSKLSINQWLKEMSL